MIALLHGLDLSTGLMSEDISKFLEKRLGRVHAKLRLGIEAEHRSVRSAPYRARYRCVGNGNINESHGFEIRT